MKGEKEEEEEEEKEVVQGIYTRMTMEVPGWLIYWGVDEKNKECDMSSIPTVPTYLVASIDDIARHCGLECIGRMIPGPLAGHSSWFICPVHTDNNPLYMQYTAEKHRRYSAAGR
jgi:hypothetical protein